VSGVVEFRDGSRMSQECVDQDCREGRVCFFDKCSCECHRHEQWSPAYGWVDDEWWENE